MYHCLERKDCMCWKDDIELYNDGQPFKISCRNSDGVVVTILADKQVPYRLLQRIMRTLSETPYKKISLAVSKKAVEKNQ